MFKEKVIFENDDTELTNSKKSYDPVILQIHNAFDNSADK